MSAPQESLSALLRRVVNRVEEGAATEDRLRGLLDAVTAIAGDLDLAATLQRIVSAAAALADARYGALGVLDDDASGLAEFVVHGMDESEIEQVGHLPQGLGVLGQLISDARPLRLRRISEHPNSHGFPERHPAMTSFLGVPIRVRDRVFGNLYLTEKRGGGHFTDTDEHAVVALAAAAAVAIENSALFESSERRSRWLGATAEIQRTLLGARVAEDVFDLVASHARAVTDGDVAVVVLENASGELIVEAVSGEDSEMIGRSLPRTGVWSDVVEHGATIHAAEGVRIPGMPGITSALVVPFRAADDQSGALLVSTPRERPGAAPHSEEIAALRGFASQAAIALQLARAREDRESLAVLADRDRIARDLHDVVIQRLFATGLSLQGLTRQLEDPALADRIKGSVADLDATIRDIRTTIFELSNTHAGEALKSQLTDVLGAAQSALKLRPHLTFSGPIDTLVPGPIQPHLVAVLIEALSNVARHARASTVEVSVSATGTPQPAVTLVVKDDGIGLPASRTESGLANLRKRADNLGGSLSLDSPESGGCVLTWSVPLP